MLLARWRSGLFSNESRFQLYRADDSMDLNGYILPYHRAEGETEKPRRMQTSTWTQSGPDQSITGQSSSPQVLSGHISGNSSTYSHPYGPVRPSVVYTQGREVRPAVQYTQGGQCLPHSSQVTSGGYWSGPTQNQQAPTKEQALMATNPLLTSLLNNNAAAQSTGVTSRSGRVNDASQPTFQQGHGSLGVNNNNPQSLVMDGQGATIYCPSDINAPLNTNCIYLQSPSSGSHQLVLDRQEGTSSGTSAAIAMGRSPNYVNHQWTVVSGQDSSRMAVQAPHQEYPQTPNSLQSAQETSSVPSRPSPLFPTAYKQLLDLIIRQNNNRRIKTNRVQHDAPVQTLPSNHSQMYPSKPLTESNNQVNVPNATVEQSMPMHNISQNPQYNVMHNPSLNHFPRYRPGGLNIPPQQNRLASNCANMKSQAGAIEYNAHHAPYPMPHIKGVSTLHYKPDGTYGLVSNNGPSSSVPNNRIQSSVQHTRESAPPPYPGLHYHGPVLNKGGHVVGVGAHSLQYKPNQGSVRTLRDKPKNTCVLLSNTGPSSSVPNHGMQFSGQQNCQSVPPSYPIRQGYYVTVTEDKSGNGFRAENVILIGDKPNESALVLQGSSASNTPCVLTVQKAIAVVQPLSQCMQANTSLNVADRMPLTTQGMSFSTSGENVRNPGEESCDTSPSQAQITLTVSASLTNESGQEVSKVSPEATLELGAEKTLTQDSETSDVEMAKTHSCFESERSLSNRLHVEKVDSQQLSNLECQATQRKELADTAMTTHVHVNQLSEETNEKEVSGEDIFELSSVPVIKWRLGKLKELVDTVQHPKCSETLVESKLLSLYWDGDGQKLMDAARSGILQSIMQEVRSVCGKDMSSQSVIFSQVRCKNWAKVEEKFVILKHDSVYPEVPEQESSWLNTNKQLDDIDKEFGFPFSLRYDQQTLQRGDEQPKSICTENEKPADSASDMQTEVIQMERPAPSESDPNKIQGSSLAQSSSQTLSPVKRVSESIVFCDPFSSLEINVLSPEEAMRFFNDQVLQDKVVEDQLELPMDVELNELKGYSVEDKSSERIDVKLTAVKLENEVDVQSEDYCCLSRWKAVFSGSTNYSLCKCQYKTELGSAKAPAKAVVEGTLVVEPSTTNAEQRESLHFCKSNGTADGKREGNPGKNENPQSWKSTGIECQTIVFSDSESETDRPNSIRTNSLPLSKPPSLCLPIKHPNIVEVEIEDVFSSYEDFLKVSTPMSEQVWDNVQPKQQLPGPLQKQMECVQALSFTLEEENPRGSEAIPTVTIPTSNLLPQPAEKISFLTSLSLAQRCHKHLSLKNNRSCKVKQKGVGHKRCVEGPLSKLSVPRKRRKIREGLGPSFQLVPEVNLTDTDDDFEPPNTSTSKSLEDERPSKGCNLQKPTEPGIGTKISDRTVCLALFGSSPQRTNGTIATGQRKDHNSSRPRPFADKAPAPPITLSVNVKSWRIEPSETSPPVESPVRERIFNEWENSFVPTKTTKSRGRASKLRGRRCLAPKIVCPKVAKKTASTNTDGTALSSERRATPERTLRAKQTLRHIARERILNGLKLRLKKYRIEAGPSSNPDTVEKVRNPAILPLEENNVLRFCVLPESFNFKDGQEPMDTRTQTGSMKEMAGPVAVTTESPKTIVRKSKVGLWSAGPQKRYCPLTSSTTKVPKSSSTAFQEFQRKFKQLSQE